MASQNFSGAYANQKILESRVLVQPRVPLFKDKDYNNSGFALQGNELNEVNLPKIWLG